MLGTRETSDHPPDVLGAVVSAWINVRVAQEHFVSVVTIATRSRPIAPVGSTAVDCRAIHVSRIDEVVGVCSVS